MWQFLKRWLGKLLWGARRVTAKLTGRPSERWVKGSYSDPRGTLYYAPLLQPKRDYLLYMPAGYDESGKRPLVVMLHGCKQDPLTFAAGTRMNRLADEHGFLVLYPEQRQFANMYYCWNWFDSSTHRGGGEAALIAGMVDEVASDYAVDAERVYVVGLSAGGAMTSILASCYGKRFAACAIHSGLMYRAADSVAEATNAMKRGSRISPEEAARQAAQQKDFAFVPALVIHGSVDQTVDPVNAEQVVAQFIAMAELDDQPELVKSSDSRTSWNGYQYEVHDYAADRVLLRKVLVDGLGHGWGGGNPKHPYNDPKGPDASRMIWEFCSAHSRSDVTETPRSDAIASAR
jgi:poly(hydroxyalkanoate) depolymerase family esterase